MELVWHAFFAAIRHEHFDDVLSILLMYDVGRYIVSREKSDGSHADSDGEHFHFMVEMYPTDYTRFAKRVFIDRFKLRGRATVGHPRQYGKVKNIENVELMQAYTVKDGNVVTNLTSEELDALKARSFKKENKRKLYDAVIADLTKGFDNVKKSNYTTNDYEMMGMMRNSIVATHIREQIKADVTSHIIDRYIRIFILYHANISEQEKIDWILTHSLNVWNSQ